jgi:Bacterial regulatory protein, Fis family
VKEIDKISRGGSPPTLKELGDIYIESTIKHARSMSDAARRLGMSYKGLRRRVMRDDAPRGLVSAMVNKLNRRDM